VRSCGHEENILSVCSTGYGSVQRLAHCDWVKGPVVAAAQQALNEGEVSTVLPWVTPADENEVREAFARVIRIRSHDAESKELADRWFFETVVRLHRAGEGEAFTGLKGDAYRPDESIVAADRALDSGALEEFEKAMIAEITAGLRQRFAAVRVSRAKASAGVEASRQWVRDYTAFVHYVEALHRATSGTALLESRNRPHAQTGSCTTARKVAASAG
jgi:hypothetical protein